MEVREVLDLVVGQDHPEAAVDKIGHFLAQEFGVLGSRLVTPTCDAAVQLFGSPRFGRGEYGYSVVSPFAKECGCRVIHVVESVRQIRASAEGRDEFLPGSGAF